MEFNGTYSIAAPRERVWKLLHDAATMQECIPGCQELYDEGAGVFKVKILVKFGPITAKYAGKLVLSDAVAPESLTITSKRGGAIISVAKVKLTENNSVTSIGFHATTKIGGKFNWLSGPVISAVADKLAKQFVADFAEIAA